MEARSDQPESRSAMIARVIGEVLQARASGKAVSDKGVIAAHQELMPELGRELQKVRRIEAAGRAALENPSGETVSTSGKSPGESIDRTIEVPRYVARVPGYSILHELNRGGQGVVYVATQLSTGRKVALKVLRDGPLADGRKLARFQREVQVLAALNHPNIVTIIDTGQAADGSRYIVMNYVAGMDLNKYMIRRQQKDPDDPSKLLRMFLKICDAVNAAHQKGIVHRDLKPGNIRVDERGEPHVLDFGLARTALSSLMAGEQEPLSITGEFMGSLPWCSPEQAEGDPDKIDARTDVYSLGVILYQMLTGGRFPYKVVGNIRDVLNNILTVPPTPPSKVVAKAAKETVDQRKPRLHPSAVNETIERIVLKALSKERKNRYQTAGEFKRDITNYLLGRQPAAHGPEPSKATVLIGSWWRLGVATIVSVAIVVGAAFAVHSHLKASSITSIGGAEVHEAPSVATLEPVVEQKFIGHTGKVAAVAIVPERNLLLTGGNSLNRVLTGNTYINDPGLDNTIRFWNLQTGLQTAIIRDGLGQHFTYQVQGIAVSPDTSQIAVTTCRPNADFSNPTLTVWRTDTQKRLDYFPLTGRAGLWSSYFSRDGQTLFALRADTVVHVFDLRDGIQISAHALDATANDTAMHCACMSEDRSLVFGGMLSGEIRMWSLAERKFIKQFTGHSNIVRAVTLSVDGSYLASASIDGTARVWEVATGRQIALVRPGGALTSVAFAGSGHDRIVTAGNDKVARLWDTHSGAELRRFVGHEDAILSLTTTPGGRMLATGSADNTARTWALDGNGAAKPAAVAVAQMPKSTLLPRINLLKFLNLSRDTLDGRCSLDNGKLIMDVGRIEFPYVPPREYDYKVVFYKTDGDEALEQICCAGGNQFAWMVGGFHNRYCAIETIAGRPGDRNSTTCEADHWIVDHRPHTSLVKVRTDGVEAFLDGRQLVEWKGDFNSLALYDVFKLNHTDTLGIVFYHGSGIIESAEVVEVSGAGKRLH